MLIDVPESQIAAAKAILRELLGDYGLVLNETVERLAAFNRVENTYLAIFLALGGLGLLLGSAGLAAVVVRNVMERRSELALLRAVGFGRASIAAMVTTEHVALLLAGLAAGALSGFVAVLPAMTAPGGDPELGAVAIWCGAVLLAGVIWIVLAAYLATRGHLVEALRAE